MLRAKPCGQQGMQAWDVCESVTSQQTWARMYFLDADGWIGRLERYCASNKCTAASNLCAEVVLLSGMTIC